MAPSRHSSGGRPALRHVSLKNSSRLQPRLTATCGSSRPRELPRSISSPSRPTTILRRVGDDVRGREHGEADRELRNLLAGYRSETGVVERRGDHGAAGQSEDSLVTPKVTDTAPELAFELEGREDAAERMKPLDLVLDGALRIETEVPLELAPRRFEKPSAFLRNGQAAP